MSAAEKLRALRNSARLTQNEVAKALGVSQAQISLIEAFVPFQTRKWLMLWA
jgi:transcriptional regulator with XRE-family HTH domain